MISYLSLLENKWSTALFSSSWTNHNYHPMPVSENKSTTRIPLVLPYAIMEKLNFLFLTIIM